MGIELQVYLVTTVAIKRKEIELVTIGVLAVFPQIGKSFGTSSHGVWVNYYCLSD